MVEVVLKETEAKRIKKILDDFHKLYGEEDFLKEISLVKKPLVKMQRKEFGKLAKIIGEQL